MTVNQFKEILQALTPLKEEIESVVDRVNEIFEKFDEIEFEPDEETEAIEAKVEKLEEAISALDDDDDEMKARLEKKIGDLKESCGGIGDAEELISQIEDLFSEIKETAENFNC